MNAMQLRASAKRAVDAVGRVCRLFQTGVNDVFCLRGYALKPMPIRVDDMGVRVPRRRIDGCSYADRPISRRIVP